MTHSAVVSDCTTLFARAAGTQDSGGEDVQCDAVHGWRADCWEGGALHPCRRHCGWGHCWHGLTVRLAITYVSSRQVAKSLHAV